MTKEEILSVFGGAGVSLSVRQAGQFLDYWDTLVSWNVKAGLISKKDESRILTRHFLESAALSSFDLFRESCNVLDLGSGGGFPGVPLKIVCPQLKIALMDSKQKKCMFLAEVCRRLGLSADVFCCRAEETSMQQKLAQKYDVVVTRAVSKLEQLYDWAQPYLTPAGQLVAVKGSRAREEIEALMNNRKSVDVKLRDFPLLLEDSKNLKVIFLRKK